MYGAMRERARHSSQLAGLASAVLATLAVGYALANGFIGQVAKLIEAPMTFTPIPEERTAVEDKQAVFDVETSLLAPAPPPLPYPNFIPDEGGVVFRPPVDAGGGIEAGTVGGGTGRTASPVRTRPALLTREPPPYPAPEIRKRSTGTTALEVCIDANGRVTSATMTSTSGHAALDAAALKWVRNARFAPARSDGLAEAMCGHGVLYQWKLEDAH